MKTVKSIFLFLFVLVLIAFSLEKRPVHIFMAGDSTMADKVLFKNVKDSVTGLLAPEEFPERGWGMLLPEFFTDSVIVENYAKNGRSSRTFIEEGLWNELISNVRKGDYVIIQFGHNDASEQKKDRYTPPEDYKKNFFRFIDETRAKGGNPILCTPVARRHYNDSGKIVNSHGVYLQLVKDIAEEKHVPMIDLHELTRLWIDDAGEEKSKSFFMHIPPGVNKIFPDGLTDNTHFVEAGARKVASLFVEEIEKLQITGLTKYLKED